MQKRYSNSVRVFYPRFSKEEVIRKIRDKLESLNKELPITLLALFGSYAKGTRTVASDVDVLIVYKGKERKDAYKIAKKVLDIPGLELHIYSEEEYEKMLCTIKRMLKDGVILWQEV
ncbi:MAG: nucleotidyltransferase domain-containing protein [Thermoproteota archaeon]|jgi:predicted nucleotidyltransferase